MNPEPGHGQCDQAELVAVYAVQALPASEVPAMQAHISKCAICSLELEKLRAVVDSFAWWPTGLLRPSESLRRRLFERIAANVDEQASLSETRQWLQPDWEPLAPGIFCKLLATDWERDRVSMLVRLTPGAAYLPDSHAGFEELHLLDGELWIDDRKLRPGDCNRAESGTVARRVWSETGCTCVLITSPRDVATSPRGVRELGSRLFRTCGLLRATELQPSLRNTDRVFSKTNRLRQHIFQHGKKRLRPRHRPRNPTKVFADVHFGPNLPDEQMRALVRARLENGHLPLAISTMLYAGPGTGTLCMVCSQSIKPQQIEYDVEISGTRPFAAHVQCYDMWLAECRQRTFARVQRQRSEAHCWQCDKLLEQFSNAVETFSTAVKDYWAGGSAGSILFLTQREHQRTKRTATSYRQALLEHYASCANHKANVRDSARPQSL